MPSRMNLTLPIDGDDFELNVEVESDSDLISLVFTTRDKHREDQLLHFLTDKKGAEKIIARLSSALQNADLSKTNREDDL